jgi:hypothetical protein
MSISDWFRRKPGPTKIATSKGGSDILKYDQSSKTPKQYGFSAESTFDHVKDREAAYDEMFGECDNVYHEVLPLVPHIDVYRYPPNSIRPFFTLVTGGMSDVPMNSPEELGADFRRAELVFYAEDNKQEYSETLRRLAHFPHENNSWLHWGHTMSNGTPPEPMFGSDSLDTLFFMPSILSPDSKLGERLSISSDPVNFIWCVPITSAECNLKLEKGTEALYDLFEANRHPFLFSEKRRSYV